VIGWICRIKLNWNLYHLLPQWLIGNRLIFTMYRLILLLLFNMSQWHFFVVVLNRSCFSTVNNHYSIILATSFNLLSLCFDCFWFILNLEMRTDIRYLWRILFIFQLLLFDYLFFWFVFFLLGFFAFSHIGSLVVR